MKVEGSIKQEHILDAAIKRFSYFGVHKTKLTEIAEDLAISKPLLFYYFQDKQSLINAVADRIMSEFLTAAEQVLQSASSVEEGLKNLVAIKREHLKKYYLLALQADTIDLQKVAADVPAMHQQVQVQLIEFIAKLLQKGIDEHQLRPVDTCKTSQLLVETLSAFEYHLKRKHSLPELADIDALFDKQVEVLQMFLQGLKQVEWKN